MKHEPLSSIVQGGGKRRQGIGYAGVNAEAKMHRLAGAKIHQ